MHWADIKAAIEKANSSLRQIADQEGVSASFVTRVVRGYSTSHAVAYAIAEKTGIPTEKMWPGRYLLPPAYARARKHHTQGSLPRAAAG